MHNLEHPNVSSIVNLNAYKKSDYSLLKNAAGWTYFNGVWTGKLSSDTSATPIGLKWKVFFMMNELGARKWTADLEVIN